MEIRLLKNEDYYLDYLHLLNQLSYIDKNTIMYDQFCDFVSKLNEKHVIYVIYDTSINKIIASGTLFIEQKLIHNCGFVGHIEDIIVDTYFHGKSLGKLIVDKLVDYAKQMKCYKVILDCSNNVEKFYEKCGFTKKNNQMALYF